MPDIRGMPLRAMMRSSIKCSRRVDNRTGPRKVRNQNPLMRDDVKVQGCEGMEETFDPFLKFF